jgi:hypothetical protein
MPRSHWSTAARPSSLLFVPVDVQDLPGPLAAAIAISARTVAA